MTSSQKDSSPDCTSELLGNGTENLNTPYLETDTRSGDLQETTAQPILTNPGSTVSTLNSPAIVQQIIQSAYSYAMKHRLKTSDLVFYTLAYYALDDRVMPAIFPDDAGSGATLKCYPDVRLFIEKFLERRQLLDEGKYEKRCTGFSPFVTKRSRVVEGTMEIKWPYPGIPMFIVGTEF